jgi:glutathione S-transferase
VLRVYHREHAGRPIRALWTLEEIGAPYELTLMSWEEGSGEEHRARHPLGRVPVLEDDEGFVFESTAICLHLADLHPQAGLLPPLGTHERALAYQWSCFAPAELEPPLHRGGDLPRKRSRSRRQGTGVLRRGRRRRGGRARGQ